VGLNATLNIAAVLLLPVEWRHVGLAASTVLCAGAGCVMFVVLAKRRNGVLGLSRVLAPLARVAAASAAMGGVLWLLKSPTARLFSALGPRAGAVVQLAVLVVAGMAVYAGFSFLAMREQLRRLRRRRT